MIVLDTNVYLVADRDAAAAERVARFVERRADAVGVSSVVVAELLVGVASAAERARLVAATIGRADPRLVVTPTHADWLAAGEALARLGGDAATRGRSFWNDLLLAASCARAGASVVTANVEDFARIRRIVPVAVLPSPA